jgi:hypothetical protein
MMKIEQASAIIGSQPKTCIQNMHRALGMMSALNSAEENERREAAGVVLKNWKKHSVLVQQRLEARFKRY